MACTDLLWHKELSLLQNNAISKHKWKTAIVNFSKTYIQIPASFVTNKIKLIISQLSHGKIAETTICWKSKILSSCVYIYNFFLLASSRQWQIKIQQSAQTTFLVRKEVIIQLHNLTIAHMIGWWHKIPALDETKATHFICFYTGTVNAFSLSPWFIRLCFQIIE